MSKNNEDINEFINQCKTLLPEFNRIRNPSNQGTIKYQEVYEYILLFLEEFARFSAKLNSNQLNKFYISFFQNKLLFQRFPNYSPDKIGTIQSIISNFLNFLILKKVIKRDLTKEISLEIQENSEIKNNINARLSSQIEQIINAASSTILNFSKNADVENLDNRVIDKFLKNIETYPEKIIVKAIFKLFEEIEDDKTFIKVLFVVDNFLKLNTLPSKTIEYLRFKVEKERTMLRLLFLYQSFYFGGYKLEKSILDVLKELNMDTPAVNKLFENSAYFIKSLGQRNLFHQPFQNSYVLFNIDKILDEIEPMNDKSPIFNPQETIGYNLPKNINLKIDKQVHQLEAIYNSTELKKEFLSAFSEDFSINSLTKTNIFLFFEARELHVKGKNNKALVLINKLLKKNPNLSPALILKGELLCELHQFHYAIKCYLKSIEINPYKIHAYFQLSYTLQIGGYFYSSYILCSHLLKFCPIDFNLYVQLAFSAYQLSKPFKLYLKIAGLLEPERLASFLDRFWIREKIEAKDSLDTLRVKKETISELEKLIIHNSNNIFQFLTYYNDLIQEDDFNEEFNEIINYPLYFFPEKLEHTKKNHFIYELATDIATNIVELVDTVIPESEHFFLNEEFLKFCFKISQDITEKIIKYNLKIDPARKTRSLKLNVSKKWIEDALQNLIEDPYFLLLQVLLHTKELYEMIQTTINQLSIDCLNCSYHCLIYPTDVFPNFKESCSEWDEANEEEYEIEINLKRSKFERDYLPILGFFELFLREKDLSEKTIEEKVSDDLEFLKFIFFNLDKQLNDSRIEIDEKTLKMFLEKHIIEKKWVQSKTAMERVKRSLTTFLSFLSNELDCLSNSKLRILKDEIKKAKFQY